MRTEVTANLQLELKRKVEPVVKEQAMKGLRDRAQLTLPRSLVDIEAAQMMRRMSANLTQQGMKSGGYQAHARSLPAAGGRSRGAGTCAGGTGARQQSRREPDQVKALVAEAAQTYEQPEAVIRWHFEKPERLNEFEAMAIEHNVVDWVLSRAQVRATPTSFEALMRRRRASRRRDGADARFPGIYCKT